MLSGVENGANWKPENVNFRFMAWTSLRFFFVMPKMVLILKTGSVNSIIHIFYCLFNLQFFGIEFVFELVDGGLEFTDGFLGGVGTIFGILEFILKSFDFFAVLRFFDGILFGGGFQGFQAVGNSLKVTAVN